MCKLQGAVVSQVGGQKTKRRRSTTMGQQVRATSSRCQTESKRACKWLFLLQRRKSTAAAVGARSRENVWLASFGESDFTQEHDRCCNCDTVGLAIDTRKGSSIVAYCNSWIMVGPVRLPGRTVVIRNITIVGLTHYKCVHRVVVVCAKPRRHAEQPSTFRFP